jgi:oxygen-independent coproporphyrinogen-3 oxidase
VCVAVSFIVQAEHLYVHVPFCARRCVYCDFSIAVRSDVPVADFIEGVRRELSGRHANSEFSLATLYFGGGTPSKLGGEGMARLLEAIGERAVMKTAAEVTIEANPEDVSNAAVRAWRKAGVNRVSLGVQSFNEGVLLWMHRTHDAEQARRSVQVLHEGGIDNVSIDLIFATPPNLDRSWERDVEEAVALRVAHVSAYGLTVEPHTPLGRRVARKDANEAPEESFEADFLAAHSILTRSGFEHYEVSNYGRSGRHSRHNWAYWQRASFGGIGPSAHEFDGAIRQWNVDPYVAWLEGVSKSGSAIAGNERIAESQSLDEMTYLGLRTQAGVRVGDDDMPVVGRWIDAGWAICDDNSNLRLTPLGWLRLDALANALTLSRSHY